jgi:rhodanese-related sulfurtransferase
MAIIQSVSAIELVKLIKNQKVKLVDIRERDEYATGNIVDSVNIPSSEFDVDKFESLQEEHIVIYCLSGKRCINVMEKLKNVPNKTFYKLEGGINAWKEAGLAWLGEWTSCCAGEAWATAPACCAAARLS